VPVFGASGTVCVSGSVGYWGCHTLYQIMFILGAAERGVYTHRHTHIQMSDRGVELSAPNVDLMMGLYELKQSAEDDGGKKRKRGGCGFIYKELGTL